MAKGMSNPAMMISNSPLNSGRLAMIAGKPNPTTMTAIPISVA